MDDLAAFLQAFKETQIQASVLQCPKKLLDKRKKNEIHSRRTFERWFA